MTLKILPFVLGPIENNAYLVVDQDTGEALVIDPPFGSQAILQTAQENQWRINHILCTHAHFDHIAGVNDLVPHLDETVRIALHPDDLPLWQDNGAARAFGLPFEPCCQPNMLLKDGQQIPFGGQHIVVLLTPGHTRGHVAFYLPQENVVFSGDLIFRQSVGRTDLEGGSHILLLRSIDQRIKPLPDETRLLSGHGPETTVGYEKRYNPFL